MRTLLICHDESSLDRDGLARWLASFSDLAGIVVLRERPQRRRRRVMREIKRIGLLRFPDVVAYKLYERIGWRRRNRQWQQQTMTQLERRFPDPPVDVPILVTHSPNSNEAEQFIRQCQCDIMIARCKVLLAKRIFTLPATATLVMHPGICPEYRNAHGCFWALACDDLDKIGLTLLKVDSGVDTGDVYGYYSYDFDEVDESPAIIQDRVAFDNLDAIAEKIQQIHRGTAAVIDTTGRPSATWGQPWMTRYIRWKWNAARRRRCEADHAALS